MKTSALLFGALVGDALAVANKWNPEGFDWASQKTRNDVAWLKNSGAPVIKQLAVQDSNQTTNASVTDVTFQSRAFLDTSLGVTLRAIGWNGAAKSTVSTAGTVLGCWDLAESELQGKATTPKSRASCAIGVGCALWGFGSTVKDYLNTLDAVEDVAAIQGIELPQLDAPDLGADFLESIDLDVFGRKKRALMRRGLHERGYSSDHHHVAQLLHNHHMSRALRDGGFGDGEFLGYAHEDHQLSKRDATHPLAARFKVDHPKKGPMVLATRHANTTFHMTAEPYVHNDGSHKARRWEEQLQKEVLENRVTEARFDTDAIESAPADLDIDKNKAFEDAEDGMHCVLGGDDWNFSDVFDIQGYDNTNRGTYNYATIGIFEDQSGDADIEQMQPQPPVSGGDCS